jgi:cytochrome c-type biogenesis protein CcmH/NrfG
MVKISTAERPVTMRSVQQLRRLDRRRPAVGRSAARLVVPVIVGALLALGAAGEARAQKSPTGQAALARAKADLVRGRLADAAAEMETAVRFEPRFAFGWYLLASTSRRAGNPDRAVEAYRRYMELRPTEPDPYYGIGLCLESIGDRADALVSFRRYVELDSRPASGEFVADARKRIARLERAKAAGPRVAGAPAPAGGEPSGAGGADGGGAPAGSRSAGIGAQLVAAHKYPEAVEATKSAVAADPADAQAWYDLAFSLRQSGQTAAAVDAYRRYITLRPKDPDPYYGLGRALATLKQDDAALTALRAYVKLETRPEERRWINKARAEITRIEAAHHAGAPAAAPLQPPAAAATREPPPLAPGTP